MSGQIYRTYAVDCAHCCLAKLLPVTATTRAKAAVHLASMRWTRRADGWWCPLCVDSEERLRRMAAARGGAT
jgi:hypothetical protein